jgi:DNA-binding transcriptional LysR family regulator
VYDADDLRVLAAVIRSGSFTAAAAELGYTQSAVSRRVAALEARTGGPLFERLPRGVRPTAAGRVLDRYALDTLARLEGVERELAAVRAGRSGTVRLGAFATANVALVPRAVASFLTRHPRVEVTPSEGRSPDLVAGLLAGALDLAVVSDYLSALLPVDGLVVEPLLVDALHVALPGGHRLAGGGPVVLTELRDETWVQHGPVGHPSRLDEACARAGFAPRRIVRIGEWTGKFGYVSAGLGVTLVPSLALPAVPATVVTRPIDDPAAARSVHLARPAGVASRATENLAAELRRAVPRASVVV